MTNDIYASIVNHRQNERIEPPPGYLVLRDHNGVRIVPRDDAPVAILPRQVDILPPEPLPDYSRLPLPPVKHEVRVAGSYVDRSFGYLITVTPLATVAGVLALMAGIGLAGVALLSWAALMWFWTSFALVWLVSFVLHTFTGADGIALIHTLQMWRFLNAEQRARLDRINRMTRDDQ